MSNALVRVCVVIPNYNGRHLLERNLPSVFNALKSANTDFEIIIIDDCSTDDSVAFLIQSYPTIRLIISDQNQGFSATCNKGIVLAEKDLILLLNTDIELNNIKFYTPFTNSELPYTFV